MEMDSQKINNFNNMMNYLMVNNMNQYYMSHFIPKHTINENNKFDSSGYNDYKKNNFS